MMEYKLFKNIHGEISAVNKFVDGVQVMSIPLDEANTDYQAYLAWVADGNTPTPADE